MYNTEQIASRVTQRIKFMGLKKIDILSKLQLGINAISQLSNGHGMSYLKFAEIADELDCSVDYLLGRTDNSDGFTEPVSNSITVSDQHKKVISLFDTLDEYQQNKIMGMLELYAFENEEAQREEA